MIRLAVRMSLRGGTEALVRLLLTSAAVAIGVAVLLAAAADFHAFQRSSARGCWECSYGTSVAGPVSGPADGELWNYTEDYFRGRPIKRLDVAALGSQAPVPPGLTRLPAAHEFYASPALAALLAGTPRDQLADRFPGTPAGVLGDAALGGPDELVVIVGRTPGELAAVPGTEIVTTIETAPEARGTTAMYRFGFGLATIALLLPLMIFVGTATRLAAARREERYAAFRLVGTTPRQINVIASVDAIASAVLGTVVGIGVFAAARPAVERVSITGARFFGYDVTPTAAGYAAVAVGVPVLAAGAALWSLRHVRVSPLGVSRRVTPKPPRFWRILPLLAGIALFVTGIAAESGGPSEGIVYPSLVLVMLGLVVAGPWLTARAARMLARLARGPAALLAARRLADNPKAAFRTVSGLTMAVFIGTAIAVLLPGLLTQPGTGGDPALRDVLRVQYGTGTPGMDGIDPRQSADMVSTLDKYPGVSVIPMYLLPAGEQPEIGPGAAPPPPNGDLPANSVVDCARLAQLPVLGTCAPGIKNVLIAAPSLFIDNPGAMKLPLVRATSRPYPGDPSGLRLGTMVVQTSDPATLERVRTYLTAHVVIPSPGGPEQWLSNAWTPSTFGEIAALRQASYDAIMRIALAAIVLTLIVAGCSIAVSTGGSMVERRRPFTLLRLTGTPLSGLTKVVLLESLLPLGATALVAATTGYGLAAAVTTNLSSNHTLPVPGAAYFATTLAGLAVSLLVILATMPLLGRLTRSDTARFE